MYGRGGLEGIGLHVVIGCRFGVVLRPSVFIQGDNQAHAINLVCFLISHKMFLKEFRDHFQDFRLEKLNGCMSRSFN
jgi:hypothetical protein